MDAIRLKYFSEEARRGRAFPRAVPTRDRPQHAEMLREQLSKVLELQETALLNRDPALPALPRGIALLMEPARNDRNQGLLQGSDVPKGWSVEVVEEREDGTLLSILPDPSAINLRDALGAWERNERDAKGKAKPGTAAVPLVQGVRKVERAARMGEALAEMELRSDEEYLVDIELTAGAANPEGAARRGAFRHFLTLAGATLPGSGYPVVADDYAMFRAYLPGRVILDLVDNHLMVLRIDRPPKVELDGMELRCLTVATLPEILPPLPRSAVIGVVDGSAAAEHPLLKASHAGQPHRSWLSDGEAAGALWTKHGTAVASIAALGSLRDALLSATEPIQAVGVCVASVLDGRGNLPEDLALPRELPAITAHLREQAGASIINHSIASTSPFRPGRMSVWAERIDHVAYDEGGAGFLFIVAAGNLDGIRSPSSAQLDTWTANREFPEYLSDARCRLRDPAQAINALTVGGYVPEAAATFPTRERQGLEPLAASNAPAPMTRCGPGYLGEIKPEVVEEAGNYYRDASGKLVIRALSTDVAVADPEFLTSGQIVRFTHGTSVAAPKVAHLAARISTELPYAKPDLIRALLVNSAEWPQRLSSEELTLTAFGYGVPRPWRVFEIGGARSVIAIEDALPIGKVHYFRIPFPKHLFAAIPDTLVRVSITLAWRTRVRRTNRRYRGTAMEWTLADRGESFDHLRERFARIIPEDTLEDDADNEDVDSQDQLVTNGVPASLDRPIAPWQWTIGINARKRGTVQKDWFEAPAAYFDDELIFAVMAKRGWMTDAEARTVMQRYAATLCIEAVGVTVHLHETIKERVQARQRVHGT